MLRLRRVFSRRLQLLHHGDLGGVTEGSRETDGTPHSANGCAPHGIEERLHAALITSRRSVPVHVLNRNHPPGIELLHKISGLITVVDLAATAHADDQHIRVTQQNLVGSSDRPGSGTYMGEIQASRALRSPAES